MHQPPLRPDEALQLCNLALSADAPGSGKTAQRIIGKNT